MTVCAACVRFVALIDVQQLLRVRECRAASALLLEKPLSPNEPLVGITRACEAAPVTNRLLPPVEIIGGTLELTFREASASDSRPPQPLFDDEVLEIDACHWCC